MIQRLLKARQTGWVLAGAAAAGLLSSAAVLAFAADRRAPVLYLDLGASLPAAPAVSAVAEAAPQVVDQAPETPQEPPPPEEAPTLPKPTAAPELASAKPVVLPEPDKPVIADLALPPPPEKPKLKGKDLVRKTPVVEKAVTEPDKKTLETAPEKNPPSEEKTVKKTEDRLATPAASAPIAASSTKGGNAISPQAFAKAVLKKVRSTRKKSGVGKGKVVVGFTIAADGSLAGVQILESSGNPALDEIAVNHISRSAPFPVPPEGAGRNFSFEFVGK